MKVNDLDNDLANDSQVTTRIISMRVVQQGCISRLVRLLKETDSWMSGLVLLNQSSHLASIYLSFTAAILKRVLLCGTLSVTRA